MRAHKTKTLSNIVSRRHVAYSPIAAAVMLALGSQAVWAQDAAGELEEVVVTAQKRSEKMQDVPISMEAIGNQKLEELNVQSFEDYAKLLPSISATPSAFTGVGFAKVYMRGIVTGGDGQATTSQPSVGTYLDEQPITTVQGNLDIHLYDIARVEALAGPQGTLYGASKRAPSASSPTSRMLRVSLLAIRWKATPSTMAARAMWPRASSTSLSARRPRCVWWAGR